MSHGAEHDPDHTPVDLRLRRDGADIGRELANYASILSAISGLVGEAARLVDGLAGIERAGYLAGLAKQLGITADELHVIRRVIDDMSRGAP